MAASFWLIFFKIIAVLLNVIVGFVAGKISSKWQKIEQDSIASLLFYFIAPIVFFSIPAHTKLSLYEISITLVTFSISTILCFSSYFIFRKYWSDNTLNILSMSSGTANTSYFMLPIATLLFDEYTLSLYMMAAVGVSIYESSVGYYICTRGSRSSKETILQVLKLPNLNAFVIGCIFGLSGLSMPNFLNNFIEDMIKTFSVLGMLMIGLSLSNLVKFTVDLKFTLAAFTAKFIFYPLSVNLFILLDKILFSVYATPQYQALQLLSLAPMATNTIVISSIIKFRPERSAATVLLSCIFVLFYIPIMIALLW